MKTEPMVFPLSHPPEVVCDKEADRFTEREVFGVCGNPSRPVNSRIGLNDLEVGQRLKVKGKLYEDGTFMALEISMKSAADEAVIEGLIWKIDHQKNTLRLLNCEFTLPNGIEIKNTQRTIMDFKDLKAGDWVKLKGKYSELKGFVPEKIKLKEATGYDLEELQGDINKIDHEKKTLEVVGFTVVLNEKMTIFDYC